MKFIKQIFSIFRPKHLPQHLQIGIQGEQEAIRYLKKEKKCTIVERNWRSGHGEIDIIAKDPNQVLLFIEVKTRQQDTLIPGFYAVSARKKAILCKTATAYLKKRRHRPKHFRFDIIEVRLGPEGNNSIHCYPNVLLFKKHAIV